MTRVLLTSQQFEELAGEFLDELHKIPLYDVGRKRELVSEYLKKVQSILAANVTQLPEDQAEPVEAAIRANLLADRLLNE